MTIVGGLHSESMAINLPLIGAGSYLTNLQELAGRTELAHTMDPSTTPNARLAQFAALTSFCIILVLPTPSDLLPAAHRLAAVIALMAILWLTQAVPLGATSLIPLAAFPLMGIQSSKIVSQSYINDSVFLYMGGFIIALGIERWRLHRRIALHVVRLLGSSPRRIVLGFALATGFLSMWISNTASALLMIPIAMALLKSMDEFNAATEVGSSESNPPSISRKASLPFGAVLMLTIAYSASLGGVATLVGTPTNLAYREIYLSTFPDAPDISAGEWMFTFVPISLLMILITWWHLTRCLDRRAGFHGVGRNFFSERIRELGPASPAERRMAVIFALTAILWLTRVPIGVGNDADGWQLPGWGPHFADILVRIGVERELAGGMASDASVAIFMAILLFIIPSGRSLSDTEEHDPQIAINNYPRRNLMDWPTANRLPWEVLLLFGGGFAIADAVTATELSNWIGERFATALDQKPLAMIIGATCGLLTFLTEFTSNTATCNILLPILGPTAIELGMDPRPLMVAATISSSFAFMLPVATPPNALVFGTGRVSVWQMARAGFALNLIGCVVVTLGILFIYVPQAGINVDTIPDWAHQPAQLEAPPDAHHKP